MPISSGAARLLDRMRRSRSGWRYNDLRRLYLGCGFESEQGGKHTLFIHPRFPALRATVTRSRTLRVGYIQQAVTLIDQLLVLEEEN
jgi:hypothetical protein